MDHGRFADRCGACVVDEFRVYLIQRFKRRFWLYVLVLSLVRGRGRVVSEGELTFCKHSRSLQFFILSDSSTAGSRGIVEVGETDKGTWWIEAAAIFWRQFIH